MHNTDGFKTVVLKKYLSLCYGKNLIGVSAACIAVFDRLFQFEELVQQMGRFVNFVLFLRVCSAGVTVTVVIFCRENSHFILCLWEFFISIVFFLSLDSGHKRKKFSGKNYFVALFGMVGSAETLIARLRTLSCSCYCRKRLPLSHLCDHLPGANWPRGCSCRAIRLHFSDQ